MSSSFLKDAIRLFHPFVVASALVLLYSGCQSQPQSTKLTGFSDRTAAADPAPDPTVLAPGDVIKLQFPGAPDLDQAQKIRPDGKIMLPLIGEVDVNGVTFAAFQQDLEKRYKTQLKNSEVVITLEGSTARTIVVDGAVRSAGAIPCDHPITAFEAIMLAGGFTGDSDMKKVQVIRRVNGEDRSVFVDLRNAMRGSPAPALLVKPGDIIFVPEKLF
jgi:polysaccharide export outer membrane protein